MTMRPLPPSALQLLLLVFIIAGCAGAPQPALPDGKARRPVNTAAAIRAYQDSLREPAGMDQQDMLAGRGPAAARSVTPRAATATAAYKPGQRAQSLVVAGGSMSRPQKSAARSAPRPTAGPSPRIRVPALGPPEARLASRRIEAPAVPALKGR